MKKNDILLLFYSLKSGSLCQYIGTEQLRDIIIDIQKIMKEKKNREQRDSVRKTTSEEKK